jgi:hypothetical protein
MAKHTEMVDSQTIIPAMKMRSRVPGRERWDVPCVRDHPNWAATVESIVGSEEGIESVIANPATGRVLVEFNPSRVTAPVQALLQRALSFRPMTASDGINTRHWGKRSTLLSATVATELVCSIFKLALLGVCPCTAVAIVPSALLLHQFASRKHRRSRSKKMVEADSVTAVRA